MAKSNRYDNEKDKKNVVIKGERIYLRTLTEDDANEEYAGWLNDNVVNQYLETKKATVEELRKYIKERYESKECIFLGIFLKKNDKHIGNIKLEPIDFENRIATMGMLIGDKNSWGKGFATEALNILVDWSFKNLNLAEMDLGVMRENAAAIRVYEKSGFRVVRENEKAFTMSRKKLRLALGTVQFGLDYGINNFKGKPSMEKSLEMLNKAYDVGIRIFDTAFAYGDAEDILGEFITRRKLENKIEVISKLKPNIIDEISGSIRENIVAAVKESLRRLKIKQLDGYLLHTPKYIYNNEVVAAMQFIKKQGFVRNIGVSIYDEEDAIYAAKSKVFDFIQVPYSVFDQRLDKTDFFEIARQNKVTVFARSAFVQGLIFMEEKNIPANLSHAAKYLKELDTIIGKCKLSRLQASLLFSYLNKDFDYVVFGVDNIKQLEQDVQVVENISKDAPRLDVCLKELKTHFANIEKSIIMPSLWKKDEKS